MNIIKKAILFIKNLFNKDKEIKKLPEPKTTTENNQKDLFIESLKVPPKKEETKEIKEVKEKPKEIIFDIPICPGDGLGIQNKLES